MNMAAPLPENTPAEKDILLDIFGIGRDNAVKRLRELDAAHPDDPRAALRIISGQLVYHGTNVGRQVLQLEVATYALEQLVVNTAAAAFRLNSEGLLDLGRAAR